jgi:hypothetical protein
MLASRMTRAVRGSLGVLFFLTACGNQFATSNSASLTDAGGAEDVADSASSLVDVQMSVADVMGDTVLLDHPELTDGDGHATAVAFHGVWSGQSVATTIQIDLPVGAVAGDLLWLTLYTDHDATLVTPPAKWTLKIDRGNLVHNFHSWWFFKIVANMEPQQYAFALSQATESSAVVVAYAGVDPVRPFDMGTTVDVDGSPFVLPAISTSRSGSLIVASLINDGSLRAPAIWTPTAPLRARGSIDTVFVGDFVQTTPGSTAAQSIASSVNGNGAATIVALNPALASASP